MQIAEAIVLAENRKKNTNFDWLVFWLNDNFEVVAFSYLDNHKDTKIVYDTKSRIYNSYYVIVAEKEGEIFVEDINFEMIPDGELPKTVDLKDDYVYMACDEKVGIHRLLAMQNIMQKDVLYHGKPEEIPMDICKKILETRESAGGSGRILHKDFTNGQFWYMGLSSGKPALDSLLTAKEATGNKEYCIIYEFKL